MEKSSTWPVFEGSWGAVAIQFERVVAHAILFRFEKTPFSRIKSAMGVARAFGVACVIDTTTHDVQFKELVSATVSARTPGAISAEVGNWRIGPTEIRMDSFQGAVRVRGEVSEMPRLGPWSTTKFYPRCEVVSERYGNGDGFLEVGRSSFLPRNMASIPCRWFYIVFRSGQTCALWQLGNHWYGFFTEHNGATVSLQTVDIMWDVKEYWESPKTGVLYPKIITLRIDRTGVYGDIEMNTAKDYEHVSRGLISGRMWIGYGTYTGSLSHAVVHAGMIGEETRPLIRAYLACGDLLYSLSKA